MYAHFASKADLHRRLLERHRDELVALWWREDHPDVTRDEIVATAMNVLWVGFERLAAGERWEG